MNPMFQKLTSIFGIITLLYLTIRTTLFVWTFLRPSKLGRYCHSGSGSWALVTGASDGIGRSFSEELLKRGFNVLLHGRNAEKLERIKKDLLRAFPKRYAETVVADASEYGDNYSVILDKAKQLPGKLTVLVNNVGGITTRPQYISQAEIEHEHIDICINTNVRFSTHLTRALLPTLKENRPSVILNAGSTGGLAGVPYLVTYSATKSYVHCFSQGLKNELVAEGIEDVDAMGVLIGNVSTPGNTQKMAGDISSSECASACLDRVGGGKSLAWAHWKAALQISIVDILPKGIMRKMVGAEMRKRVEVERKGM